MYRQQISRKTSSLFNQTSVSRKQTPSRSYEPLSWVVRRAQQDPKSLSGDEWQQLESAIGTRAVREILAGKKTPWVPDLKSIAEQLGVVSGTEDEPIQTKRKKDVSIEEQIEEPKKPWIPEFKGISSQQKAETRPMNLPIQGKLKIGEVGDKYEREAERVAKEVVQQINRPAQEVMTQGEVVQGKASEEEEELRRKPMPDLTELEEEEEKLQRKVMVQPQEAIGGGEASKDLESAINRARGSGQPLDGGLQQSMGEAMGADFSGVRVHTDAEADRLNQSLQAKAFTTGQDMFFRQGEYQPGSQGGQELIAHELTHVVQQRRRGKGEGSTPWSEKGEVQRFPIDLETTTLKNEVKVVKYYTTANFLNDHCANSDREAEKIVDRMKTSMGKNRTQHTVIIKNSFNDCKPKDVSCLTGCDWAIAVKLRVWKGMFKKQFNKTNYNRNKVWVVIEGDYDDGDRKMVHISYTDSKKPYFLFK